MTSARWLGSALAITLLWIVLGVVREVARRTAEPETQQFEAFARSHAAPRALRLAHLEGVPYLVWTDETPGTMMLLRVGSGPPCYIFDARGNLVAWSATTGDGELRQFLAEAGGIDSRSMSTAQAAELIRSGGSTPQLDDD